MQHRRRLELILGKYRLGFIDWRIWRLTRQLKKV